MKYIIIGICLLIIAYSIYTIVKSVVKKIKGKGCNGDCSSCSGCPNKKPMPKKTDIKNKK